MNTRLPFLVKLSEKDLRLIIAIFLIVLLVFLIFALIYDVVKQVMRRQGRRVDADMHLLVEADLIKSPKQFKKIARRKSNVVFYKQLLPAFLILIITIAIHGIVIAFMGKINLFDYKDEGIGTLFHVFDWDNQPKTKIFGITVASDWPELLSSPHFSARAIPSYIIVPLYFTCIIWFFIVFQAYLSRTIRINVLGKKLFSSDLDDKRLLDLSALDLQKSEEVTTPSQINNEVSDINREN